MFNEKNNEIERLKKLLNEKNEWITELENKLIVKDNEDLRTLKKMFKVGDTFIHLNKTFVIISIKMRTHKQAVLWAEYINEYNKFDFRLYNIEQAEYIKTLVDEYKKNNSNHRNL